MSSGRAPGAGDGHEANGGSSATAAMGFGVAVLASLVAAHATAGGAAPERREDRRRRSLLHGARDDRRRARHGLPRRQDAARARLRVREPRLGSAGLPVGLSDRVDLEALHGRRHRRAGRPGQGAPRRAGRRLPSRVVCRRAGAQGLPPADPHLGDRRLPLAPRLSAARRRSQDAKGRVHSPRGHSTPPFPAG